MDYGRAGLFNANSDMENNIENTPREQKRFPIRLPANSYLYFVAAFTLLGVAGGFAYYWFVGCKTGGCAITSSPYLSMLWGGAMGYLLPDFFVKKDKEKK